jgi:DnaJ family protein C protein 17
MEASPETETKPTPAGETPEIDRTVKARFSREGEATSWDKEKISSMFAKYGKIDSVVMGKDKKIRVSGEKHRKVTAMVLVVYTRLHYAYSAVTDAKHDYPLLESVAWAGKEPEVVSLMSNGFSTPSTPLKTPNKSLRSSFSASIGSRVGGSAPGTPSFSFSPKTPHFEDITMMRLKQAEKKRLEEQIRKREAAEDAAA